MPENARSTTNREAPETRETFWGDRFLPTPVVLLVIVAIIAAMAAAHAAR